MKTDIMKTLTRAFYKSGLVVKKHSPEVLICVGVVGVVTSTVMACKATTKASKIADDFHNGMDTIHKVANDDRITDYSEDDMKRDTTIIYTKTALEYAKIYGPAVAVGAASIGCIVWSHCILSKRNIALASAYATVSKGFKDYRGRVIERFGKDLDRELRYNLKAREVEEIVTDENGEEKVVTTTMDIPDGNPGLSMYSACFDETCMGWTRDAEANKRFLLLQQAYANKKLQAQGYLFLNDVLEMLGIQKTKAGQIVGWIYNEEAPIGDNYVDFGIFNIACEPNRRFVNGYEKSIWLDFNVDGNILDMF